MHHPRTSEAAPVCRHRGADQVSAAIELGLAQARAAWECCVGVGVGTDRVVERHWLRRVTQQKTPIAVLARAEYGQLLQTVIDAIPVNDADQSTDYGLSIVVGTYRLSDGERLLIGDG